MSLSDLTEKYKLLAVWTIDRENSKTENGNKEYVLGLRRIEEYEDELRARGFDTSKLGELYAAAVFTGEAPLILQH